MHIAIVLDSFNLGGAEILSIRLARKFQRRGISVSFIALHGDGEMSEQIKKMGAKAYVINSESGVRVSTMFQLFLLMGKIHPDILLTNHFRPLLHVWLAALLCRIPLYHIEHDNLHYRTKSRYLKILRFLLFGIKKMIVISPSLFNYFKGELGCRESKLLTIANGVDREHFTPERNDTLKKEITRENVVFGTCARLVPIKNIAFMLDVFYAYRQKYQGGHLVLVGEGVCRLELEERVAQYGLQDYVSFVGYQEDCAPWLQLMDYYLLTSDDEGLPLSVLEAMACGVVVVSRNVGDMERLFADGGGVIVGGTKIPQWLDALEEIGVGTERYSLLSQQAQKVIEEKYSFDNCVEQYLQLFSCS